MYTLHILISIAIASTAWFCLSWIFPESLGCTLLGRLVMIGSFLVAWPLVYKVVKGQDKNDNRLG